MISNEVKDKGIRYIEFDKDTWGIAPKNRQEQHVREALWLLIDFIEECKKQNVRP